MEKQSDLAIVLRAVPYQERSKIVTALTEKQGKVTAVATNAIQSRRFGAALEVFTAGDWTYVDRQGSELLRLDSAVTRRAFDHLRKDYERYALASVFVEMILRVAPEREPVPELFRLLANALDTLDRFDPATDITAKLLNAFVIKLFQSLGIQPQLQQCLGCETTLFEVRGEVSGSIAHAGWQCSNCHQQSDRSLPIPIAAFKDLLLFSASSIRQAPALAQASAGEHQALFPYLEALMVYHIPGIAEQPLKTLSGRRDSFKGRVGLRSKPPLPVVSLQ